MIAYRVKLTIAGAVLEGVVLPEQFAGLMRALTKIMDDEDTCHFESIGVPKPSGPTDGEFEDSSRN